MKNIFFNKQIKNAKDDYNYFFIKLISNIIRIIFKLAVMLLISNIFNNIFINIIALLYTLYSLSEIILIYNYYTNIISDIKNTLGYNEFCFEIDLNVLYYNLFKGKEKYGK